MAVTRFWQGGKTIGCIGGEAQDLPRVSELLLLDAGIVEGTQGRQGYHHPAT